MNKLTQRIDKERLLLGIAAPLLAVVAALVVTTLVILATGKNPGAAFSDMLTYGSASDSQVYILNKATTYYLAGVSVAIGFRMNLFNIGVDGQYRIAAFFAAVLGGALTTPGWISIPLIILCAMGTGAVWAAIAGVLKVTRGVSEVISTIMLNFIAGGLFAWLLTTDKLGVRAEGSNAVTTPILEKDAWIPGLLLIPGTNARVYGFGIIALLVGIGYWFMIERTRFGFDLRATGLSPSAAVASGVNAKRMVVVTMMLSGAVAGLVGLPELLGQTHAVSENVGGYGFTGIAIALLGRNHPVGMLLGAALWGALENSAQILDLNDIPRETVTIMQGTTVLAVVVAYELTARLSRRVQQRRVGETTGATAVPAAKEVGA